MCYSFSHIEFYFLVDHCSSFELCILVKSTTGEFIGVKQKMSLELFLVKMLHLQSQVKEFDLKWFKINLSFKSIKFHLLAEN